MTVRSMAVCLALAAASLLPGQTREELAGRFGKPASEVFLLPDNIKVKAAYSAQGSVCRYRIETRDHSERTAPNLTDPRYWTDARQIDRLIAELVPDTARRGAARSHTVGLRVGEHMHVESGDALEITRIQRSRKLVAEPEVPVADRLVKIVFKRPECIEKQQ